MARAQLIRTINNAEMLATTIQNEQQLDGWVQAKITLASDYLSKVFHYLHGQEVFDEE